MRESPSEHAAGALGGPLRYLPLVLLLAALVAQALPPILLKSGVCDEHGAHIPSGYVYLRTGVFSGGVNNPPLMQVLVAAPLVASGVGYSPFSDERLWAARLPVLGLSVLLALAVYSWAGALFGGTAALGALFLYCLEPNVIAHSGLATLDMGVTVFLFISFFLLWRNYRGGAGLSWMAACASMTLALLCKFTALFALPVFVPLLLVSIRGKEPLPSFLKRAAIRILFLGACIVLFSHLFYHLPVNGGGGTKAAVPASIVSGESDTPGSRGAVERAAGFILPDLYVEGSLGKLRHSEGGHFAYLAGRRSLGGWWYYFPAAIALKTPIPFLCLLAASVVVWITRRKGWKDAAFLLLPMLVHVGAMASTGVNIGVRHVLLFYPCAAVAGSAVLAGGLPKNKIVIALIGACAAWQVYGAARIHPHYLAYFNEIAGGPAGGPQYLIDSNIDWGQDDRLLREFIAGEADTVLVNPGAFSPSVGTIAVNVNSLRGIFRGDDTAYGWLRRFEPDERLGYTWYVYRLDLEDFERAAAESGEGPEAEIWLATALKKSGELDKALELAREVAAAHPDRAGNVMFTAGWWLLESGRYQEATAAFKSAAEAGAGNGAREALAASEIEVRREKGEASASALRELAEFYARNDRTVLARLILTEAIESNPDDAPLRLGLGLLCGREGLFQEARSNAARALELDPSLERAQRALDWASSIITMEGMEGNPGAQMELGRYEYGFGRPRSAAHYYWNAFKLDPSSEAALAAMGEIIVQSKLGVIRMEPAERTGP